MKKYSLFLFAITFLLQQLHAQITVLDNSRERLVFEWNINSLDTVSVNTGKGWFTIPSFKGQNTVIGSYQTPIAPGQSLFVGVPQQGEINVTIEPIKVVSIHLNHPIKLQSDSSRQTKLDFQSQWICKPLYSNIGPFRTAQLVIKPFLYNSVAGNSSVMLSGKVTIEFPTSNGMSTVSSGSRFSQMMKKMLINYSVAQSWGSVKKLSKKMVETNPLPVTQKMVYFEIGDGHTGLNEGTINENGIVKIPAERILESFGTTSQIFISRVALYSSFKGALPEAIPQKGAIPDGISEVPLFRYDMNGNGILEKDDYFLAYVSSVSDWTFGQDYKFSIDNYDESRTYWLTLKAQNGLTLQKFVQPVSTSKPVDFFTNRMFCKQSKEREPNSEGGNIWVWKKLSQKESGFGYNFDFPLLDTTSQGQMVVHSNLDGMAVSFADVSVLKDTNDYYNISKWGNRNLRIDLTYTGDSYCNIYDIEFRYKSKLLFDQTINRMAIFSSNDSGVVNYRVSGIKNKNVFLFRVSSDENISLVDTIRSTTSDTYTWADSGNHGTRYFACDETGFLTLPVLNVPVNLQSTYLYNDLRSTLHSTDYLIITHPDFLNESDKLAAQKKKIGFKNPCVVDINEIYRSFGGGNKDPVAIRNFLAYVKRNWTGGDELLFVVLMGTGHNDPKNYNASETDFIPIYQNNTDLQEDFFSFTESDTDLNSSSNTKPQLVIGRFPCYTRTEADVMVTKVVEMEDPQVADFGSWRNRAMFVADDDMQGNEDDPIMLSNPHYSSSDKVVDLVGSKWPSLDIRKTYLFEYEWNAAREKPGATQAILNEFNNGIAYVNYFGHGADVLWADEHVLKVNDISSMTNNKQYPIVSSFSCDVGRFDVPGQECLSGALVKAQSAGACATISSTRLAYASENEALALSFYSNLFDSSETVIGAAYFMAKSYNVHSGHHSYALFGDPSLQFVCPGKKISLQVSTTSSTQSDSLIDTLQALQQIKISGSIQKNDQTIDSDFGNGTIPAYINIGLFNAPDSTSRKDGGAKDYRYLMPGTVVFLRATAVQNGKFEQTYYLPRNLSFDKPGVKLTGYAWKETVRDVAVGVNDSLLFYGSVPGDGANNDTAGPSISVRPIYDNATLRTEDFSFTDKITSLLPLNFKIDLYDESGIDVSGSGPDEGLTYEVSGVFSKKNINSKFISTEGDYREGSASVEIEKNTIEPGTYELIISARDLRGNISLKKIALEVTTQEEIKLDHVFNFPNPFKMGQTTRFYFYPSNTTFEELPVSIYIKIYSLSGKLLKVFTDAHNGIVWDGRDQAGNILSPNVYLFQITAYSSTSQKKTKSKIQKIVIHPPR
jgi:hypothetical protein